MQVQKGLAIGTKPLAEDGILLWFQSSFVERVHIAAQQFKLGSGRTALRTFVNHIIVILAGPVSEKVRLRIYFLEIWHPACLLPWVVKANSSTLVVALVLHQHQFLRFSDERLRT